MASICEKSSEYRNRKKALKIYGSQSTMGTSLEIDSRIPHWSSRSNTSERAASTKKCALIHSPRTVNVTSLSLPSSKQDKKLEIKDDGGTSRLGRLIGKSLLPPSWHGRTCNSNFTVNVSFCTQSDFNNSSCDKPNTPLALWPSVLTSGPKTIRSRLSAISREFPCGPHWQNSPSFPLTRIRYLNVDPESLTHLSANDPQYLSSSVSSAGFIRPPLG
mmetsp:Transcript_87987/g.137896  ORF Transcript_87987/g.137896 Transcript_87987/m.137896 type:complete len:217 (+) Transcript_87987:550-1200(+)